MKTSAKVAFLRITFHAQVAAIPLSGFIHFCSVYMDLASPSLSAKRDEGSSLGQNISIKRSLSIMALRSLGANNSFLNTLLDHKLSVKTVSLLITVSARSPGSRWDSCYIYLYTVLLQHVMLEFMIHGAEARRTASTNRGRCVVGDLYKSCKLSTSWQSMHFRIPGCQKVL
jgi:hypothetical protein